MQTLLCCVVVSGCFSFTALSALLDSVVSIALNIPRMSLSSGIGIMALKVYCDKCGAVLYQGEELKSPFEIIEGYEGSCPSCHSKLSHAPKSFEVMPTEENA